MKQYYLQQVLTELVVSFGQDNIPDFHDGMGHELIRLKQRGCYVCSRRSGPDGSKLVQCGGCKLIYYCSR